MTGAKRVSLRDFSSKEHNTWRLLFDKQLPKRDQQIHPLFSAGIQELGFTAERIPDLQEVNRKLYRKTGFVGVPVEGFEAPESFYELLAQRQFPIGYFIREPEDLGYTPAPDVFHDLYGHLPFLVDKDYADFTQEFGKRTIRYRERPELLRQWERLYWFGVEFPLIDLPEGRRIFGAGIASSFSECAYSLSNEPELLPFDIEVIRNQEFNIDEMQKRIFLLKNVKQLYGCLDAFEKPMR